MLANLSEFSWMPETIFKVCTATSSVHVVPRRPKAQWENRRLLICFVSEARSIRYETPKDHRMKSRNWKGNWEGWGGKIENDCLIAKGRISKLQLSPKPGNDDSIMLVNSDQRMCSRWILFNNIIERFSFSFNFWKNNWTQCLPQDSLMIILHTKEQMGKARPSF